MSIMILEDLIEKGFKRELMMILIEDCHGDQTKRD